MYHDEYVPTMMPTSIATEKPRSTRAAEHEQDGDGEQGSVRRDQRSDERLVHAQVDRVEERAALVELQVLADAVEHDDDVVERVSDDRQERGDRLEVELELEQGKDAESDGDVVDELDDAGRRHSAGGIATRCR